MSRRRSSSFGKPVAAASSRSGWRTTEAARRPRPRATAWRDRRWQKRSACCSVRISGAGSRAVAASCTSAMTPTFTSACRPPARRRACWRPASGCSSRSSPRRTASKRNQLRDPEGRNGHLDLLRSPPSRRHDRTGTRSGRGSRPQVQRREPDRGASPYRFGVERRGLRPLRAAVGARPTPSSKGPPASPTTTRMSSGSPSGTGARRCRRFAGCSPTPTGTSRSMTSTSTGTKVGRRSTLNGSNFRCLSPKQRPPAAARYHDVAAVPTEGRPVARDMAGGRDGPT